MRESVEEPHKELMKGSINTHTHADDGTHRSEGQQGGEKIKKLSSQQSPHMQHTLIKKGRRKKKKRRSARQHIRTQGQDERFFTVATRVHSLFTFSTHRDDREAFLVSTLQQDAEQSYCGTSNPSVVTVVAAVLPLPGRSHHEARHDRRCDLPARAHFSRICDPPAREEEVGRRIKKRKEVQVCSAWPDGAQRW